MKKRVVFALLALFAAFVFSCADTEGALSKPIYFSVDIYSWLGLPEPSGAAGPAPLAVAARGATLPAPMPIVIEGAEYRLKVTLTLNEVGADGKPGKPLEEQSVATQTTPVQFAFEPVAVGTRVQALLTIQTDSLQPITLMAVRTEPAVVGAGANVLTFRLPPPLVLWNWEPGEDKAAFAYTPWPLGFDEAELVLDADTMEVWFDFGSDHRVFFFENDNPDHPFFKGEMSAFQLNKRLPKTDFTTIDESQQGQKRFRVTDSFVLNDRPYFLVRSSGEWGANQEEITKLFAVDLSDSNSRQIPFPDMAQMVPEGFELLEKPAKGGEPCLALWAAGIPADEGPFPNGAVAVLAAFKKTNPKQTESPMEQVRYAVEIFTVDSKTDRFACVSAKPGSLFSASLSFDLNEERIFDQGSPASDYWMPTDMQFFDGKLALLFAYVNQRSEETFGLAAAVSLKNPHKIEQVVGQWPNSKGPNAPNSNAPLSPESEAAASFFGPQKVIGVTQKRLFVADFGFFADSQGQGRRTPVNRIVTLESTPEGWALPGDPFHIQPVHLHWTND